MNAAAVSPIQANRDTLTGDDMNLEELSDNELLDALSLIEDKLATIKTQVDFAKSNAASKKEYSDPDWFNNAKHALRRTGLKHQQINREISKRKNEKQKSIKNSFQYIFVDVAHKQLDKETFDRIFQEAKSIVGTYS